jgi:putative SOS response-associated peptidase YedK
MCGRFSASFEFREIKIRWNLQRDIPLLTPRYNIAPSQEVPVIIRTEDRNEVKQMLWGLVPSWAPDPSIGQHMINARAETLLEKPSFKQLVATRRCLVPADGFYEWRREGKHKVPMWIYLKNPRTVCFRWAMGLLAGPRRRQRALHFHDHHHGSEHLSPPHSQPNASNLRQRNGAAVA